MIKHIIFFLFSMCCLQMQSQPICNIRKYSIEDGLSHNHLTQIIQDQKGFIWVGTWNGLNRIDGYSINSFFPTTSEPGIFYSNRLDNIALSSTGNIWCLTNSLRLLLYNTQAADFFDIIRPFEKKNNQIYEIKRFFTLSKGVTWASSSQGLCFRISDSGYDKENGIQSIKTNSKQIKGDSVYMVREDYYGNEWILTNKGVTVYGKSINNDYPFSMMEKYKTDVVLASSNGNMAIYNFSQKTFSFVTVPDISKINATRKLGDNEVVLTTDNGILIYNIAAKKFRRYNLQFPGQPDKEATNIYIDSHNCLWVYTNGPGIIRINPQTEEKLWMNTPAQYSSAARNNLPMFFEDANHVKWAIPRYGVLSYFDPLSKTLKCHLTQSNEGSVPYSMDLKNVVSDRQRNLWATSNSNQGLLNISFSKQKYRFIPLDKDIETRALMVDANKRLWIATKKGNIRIYNKNKQFEGFLSSSGSISATPCCISASGVYSMTQTKNGDVWVGTRGDGIYLFSQKAKGYQVRHFIKSSQDNYSLSNNDVYSIYQDIHGFIWIGTWGGGLNKAEYKNGNIRFINYFNRLKNYPFNRFEKIRTIAGTASGNVLIGTTSGLITFSTHFQQPEAIKFYKNIHNPQKEYSLNGSDIMHIYCTDDQQIFICMMGTGINKVVSGNLSSEDIHFEKYDEKKGLASNLTYSMIKDKEKNYWVISPMALSRITKGTQSIEKYTSSFFNNSFVYSETSPAIADNGDLLIGVQGGMLILSPKEIHKSTYQAPIVFSSIKFQKDSLPQTLNDANYLEIPSDQRNFTLNFGALDYINPSDIEYAYKVDNVDKHWNYIGKNHFANFVNLPAGTYTFYVKSTNSEGMWNQHIRTLTIKVNPTFWESCWGWALYVILFLILSVAISYILFYIFKLRHEVDVEQQLAEIKIRFFTDISHELRTPLTLIAGPVAEVLSQEPLSKRAKEHLLLVQKNTSRMLQLVNQILDFRKIQNKRMTLAIEKEDIIQQIHNIMSNFNLLAVEREINFRLNTTVDQAFVWIDRDKFEKIMFNLLSNAFKYTPKKRSIIINVTEEENNYCISIEDEGNGIQADQIKSIFERFTTIPKIANMQPSSGIGLSLVNEFVKMLHAQISVESTLGQGSTFTLCIKKGKEHYKADENVEFILNDSDESTESDETEDTIPSTDEEPTSILIVEDNLELQEFMSTILSPTYKILKAADGAEGLDIVKKEIPDFIITDIMMPNMDGLEMIHHIKADISVCHIPIVVLSAKSSLDDRIQGLELGIDDYITKPFSAAYLKSRIANLIKQREMLQKAFLSQIHPKENETSNSEPVAYTLDPPQIVPLDKLFIEKIMTFIEENLTNSELNIEDIANHMNMSRSIFYRKVKMIVGLAPVDFIRHLRIQRAVQLLNIDSQSFSQIAYEVGFSDPKYFSKSFKKEMEMTPSEYKKKISQNKED